MLIKDDDINKSNIERYIKENEKDLRKISIRISTTF